MISSKIYRLLAIAIMILCSMVYFSGCTVSYSFTGASISPEVKSFTVYYFPNRAQLVNASLSQELTEALQDKLTRQTSLNMSTEGGDLEYDGQITSYSTQPMNISEGDASAQTRLTVGVKVKFTNNKNHDEDWDKTFSAYEDYDSSKSLSQVEDELVGEIIDKIVEDIFNASVANW